MMQATPRTTLRSARPLAAALLGLTLCAASARAEQIAVKVIEVAGDQAYVAPGRGAGLRPGTKISFRGQTAVVLEATDQTAAVRLGPTPLAPGDDGVAEVTAQAQQQIGKLAAPRPAADFAGQWSQAVPPATRQRPTSVPLGSGVAPGRARVTMIGQSFAFADRDHLAAQAEARILASLQPLAERPLSLDLDLAARAFADGFDARSRTPVLARAAQLRWGPAQRPQLLLGRLRHAAASVGMLDGARAQLAVGALGLAAFGGIVPDPLSGKPDPSAARFGAELSYDARKLPWQPHLDVSAHGSTWNGSLDERRLAVALSAGGAATWLDAWAEAQAFSSDNPWGAAAVEVTGAGTTAQWRQDGRHLGLDVTYLRPERSQRLAAALPLEQLCLPRAEIGDVATTCAEGPWWAAATASAGLRRRRWAVDAIASLAYSDGAATGSTRSITLRGEHALGAAWLEAEASAGKTSFASWTAAAAGARLPLTARTELGLRYRPELLDYVASTGPALIHAALVDGRYQPSPALQLAASAMAQSGEGRQALALSVFVAWRPLP